MRGPEPELSPESGLPTDPLLKAAYLDALGNLQPSLIGLYDCEARVYLAAYNSYRKQFDPLNARTTNEDDVLEGFTRDL